MAALLREDSPEEPLAPSGVGPSNTALRYDLGVAGNIFFFTPEDDGDPQTEPEELGTDGESPSFEVFEEFVLL